MSGIEILLNDSRGVYIPRDFVDMFDWANIDTEDAKVCGNGPDEEWYWEAWDNILNNARHVDAHNNVWTLYQDGDLFAVCESLMTDEEYQNFYGESRV